MADRSNRFDTAAARTRCRRYRRRILDISQQVSALHIGSAYSCTEIVDAMYNGLMRTCDLDPMNPPLFLWLRPHSPDH